ncbi:MAG TPA: YDG domain-containing protein, partial [Sphingobacteriaceae bacterium]
ITLNWAANSESDLAGYSIYGGTTANPTTIIATVNRPVTTYTHTGLTNGTGYYYRISAVDNTGNESAVTGDVTAIPRAQQSVTFNALTPKTYGDLDFDPGASASSGLTVSYISDNPAVATIVSGKVHIMGAGTAVITATQPGTPAFYAASDVSQVLTVNKKDINVSLNATPEITRIYNSSTVAALVPANYSLQGLETGDDVSITGTAAYDNKNSGPNKPVTVNSFVLSGTHKDNYNLTTTTASTVGTITAKNISLNLNAAPAINKVYNGSSAATLVPDNYVLIGIESGDVVGVTGIAAYADKNTGSGKPVTVTSFALSGADKDNYTLTTTSATTTGNIVAKELLLGLNASPLITKTYDGSAAANLLPGNYSLSGVETGDIVTVTGTAAYSDRNAGTGKLISVNSFTLAGTDKNNYTLTTTSATTTGEIKAKELSLSLNASPVITKVYDATAAANLSATNYALSGVESGDDVTVTGTASYSDKNVRNSKTVTVSGLNLSGAQRGNYNLTTSTATTTGNITVKDITLSINPIPAVSKVYDGTTAANLSSTNYILTGVEPGDLVTVTGTAVY